MSAPLIPGPLAELGRQPFALYPAIVGIEHNQWMLRRATASEVEIVNTKSGNELTIPRRFVGEVSRVEAPVLIVGLVKELEYAAGSLVVHRRHVIELPVAVNDAPAFRRPSRSHGPAPVVQIRLDHGSESRTARRLLGSFAAGLLACVGIGIGVRDAHLWRGSDAAATQRMVPLSGDDDFRSVVNKLGTPAGDRWQVRNGVTYRRLWYPQRGVAVILVGGSLENLRFVRTVTPDGRVLQSAGEVQPARMSIR